MGSAWNMRLGLAAAAMVVTGCSGGGGGAHPVAAAPRLEVAPAVQRDAGRGKLPSAFSRQRRDAGTDALYPRVVGIPKCDEYLFKFQRCMDDKVPANQRTTFEAAFATQRQEWIQHAAGGSPPGRQALNAVCEATLRHASRSLRSYGCSW
jgi:hypothetical protein